MSHHVEHDDPRAPWKLTANGTVHAVFYTWQQALWYWDQCGYDLPAPLDVVDRYGQSILDEVFVPTRRVVEQN